MLDKHNYTHINQNLKGSKLYSMIQSLTIHSCPILNINKNHLIVAIKLFKNIVCIATKNVICSFNEVLIKI